MFGSLRSLFRNKQRRALLQDKFGKPVAAGALNATPAIPGPSGNRVATDTESKMAVVPWLKSEYPTQSGATFGAANNRCSYYDGQSWIGFVGSNIAQLANSGLRVTVTDSAGKRASGWLGAAGTGETLGDELVPNGGFDSGTGWTAETGWAITDGKAVATAAASGNAVYRSINLVIGKEYKTILDIVRTSGTLGFAVVRNVNLASAVTGTSFGYANPTAVPNRIEFWASGGAFTGEADNYSIKEVTAPSSSCVYVYKDRALTQNGWYMETGYNMNDTSYTITLGLLTEKTVYAAGTCASFGAANNRCSYYAGQSWIGFAGADFGNAGLDTGRWYLVRMFDSSSRMAYCYIQGGNVGSGEALGGELVTNGDMSSSTGWTLESGFSIAGGVLSASASIYELATQSSKMTVSKLYYGGITVNSIPSGSFRLVFGNTSGGITYTTTGIQAQYAVCTSGVNNRLGVQAWSSLTAEFDNCTYKEVTAPAATCAYAYSSPNGTQGWVKDGNFNMNDTAYTYSIFELSGTKLVCAGGKAAVGYGDPGLWYPAITRQLGRTVMFAFTKSQYSSQGCELGLDTNQASYMNGQSFYYLNLTFSTTDSGSNGPIIYVPSVNTLYYLAIRLLSAGAEYYLRTETGSWRLLWRGGTNNTATLYPGISNYSAAFWLDQIKVPADLWNPPCLLYDSFTRADGAIGSSESVDSDGVSAPVRTWLGTTATVSSAKMILTPTMTDNLQADPGCDAPANWSGADWTVSGGIATKVAGASLSLLSNSGTPTSIAGTWVYAGADITRTIGGYTLGNIFGSWQTSVGTVFRTIRSTGTIMGVVGQSTFEGTADNIISKHITFASTLNLSNLGTSDVLADCYITALTAGTQAGLALCWDSESNPQNGLLVYYDGDGYIKLDKCIAGTWTGGVISVTQTHSADARLRAIKDGTSVTVYFNNTAIGTAATVPDAGIISNTLHGVFSTYKGNTFSKIHIMKRGALNEFRELDNYIH